MKEKNNKSKNTVFSNVILGSIFGILILLIFIYKDGHITKFLHRTKDYYYVSPSVLSAVLFFLLIAAYIILVLSRFNKINKKVPRQKTAQNDKNKSKKVIFKSLIIVALSLTVIIVNFVSISYINNDFYHDAGGENISLKNFDSVEVCVEKDLFSHGRGAIYYKYNVVCTVMYEGSKYIFDSSNFYGYDKIYEFLLNFDESKISICISDFDDLIKYEKNKLFKSKEKIQSDVEFIEKIANIKSDQYR